VQPIADGGKAVDELLNGMTEGLMKGRWESLESSELRRLDLLPTSKAHGWDDLMLHPAYVHTIALIP
jgi:beta-N-acetylhexosaminidase